MAISSSKKASIKHNGMIIHFDEKGHVYKVYDKDEHLKHKPISVTTLIHKYQKPFDLEGISLKCAQKEGVTQDEIKMRWAKINKTACKYGTKMHSVVEKIFNGEFVDDSKFNADEQVVFNQINRVVAEMKEKPFDYESEKLVFDPTINVAGTIDLLGRNRDTGNYVIIDWKTNKRIRMDNEWGDTFLKPLDSLPDCEFSLYGLQLSMYEKILKDGGFIDKNANVKKFICHFHPSDGCHFHQVDESTFAPHLRALVDDWKRKQELSNMTNIDIPQF